MAGLPSLPVNSQEGKVLLEIDGLDELSQTGVKELQKFIAEIRTKYPKTRLLLGASSYFLDGFIQMGIIPLPVAKWTNSQTHSIDRTLGKTLE